MRKFVLAVAAAGAALSVAAPASAQYYPGWEGRGGYDYGRGANPYGLHKRIDNVLRSLGGVYPNQRYRIRAEAIELDRGLRRAAYNGLSRREHRDFDIWIAQLERRTGHASMQRGYRYDRRDRHYSDRGRRWDRD